jgi:hypothetical protein
MNKLIKGILNDPAIYVILSLLSLILSNFIPNYFYVIIIIFMGSKMKYKRKISYDKI